MKIYLHQIVFLNMEMMIVISQLKKKTIHHILHGGNSKLSYFHFENNVDNKDGPDKLPLSAHENFIQYGHDEVVAVGY